MVKQQRKQLQLDAVVGSEEVVDKVDEWSQFQSAFELITSCGEMVLNCANLNSAVCRAISSSGPLLRTPGGPRSPFGPYNYLTKRAPQQLQRLFEMLSSLEEGVCVCMCVCVCVRVCMK